jgi:hydrogenase nickel incorporation protein HypA/HybF
MHELAAVGALIEAVVDSLASHGTARVAAIRVRRGSAFSEAALGQSFELLSRGTPLEGARLVVEVVELTIDCPCGRSQAITSDDLIGHMYVCTECGSVRDLAGVDDLEVVDVTLGHQAIAGG